MWHDIEAEVDLLNFGVVADAAAQLIRDSGGKPLTIGISGGWGVGKSSLVNMIGSKLRGDADAEKRYITLEFNAWLYQGYDDARQALLQSVAETLAKVSKDRKPLLQKVMAWRHRIRWLKVAQLLGPTVGGAMLGTAVGPVGTLVGAVGGLIHGIGAANQDEEIEKVRAAYATLNPDLAALISDKAEDSLPREVDALRAEFEEILKELNVTLVVLVDDLDRCLPNTAISTLEAMRLLLYVPRTAFIIAADEQMIRGAVRAHFSGVDIGDDLVTSYFDKLIQVPLRVPRLGVNEVRTYLILLLAELQVRRGALPAQALADAQGSILAALRNAWSAPVTREVLERSFGPHANSLSKEIDIAEHLAPLLVTAQEISGNPRLIKRFLNNLMLRETIAKAQGMTVGIAELTKMQLFERCASPAAFEYLAKSVASNEHGRAAFLVDVERSASEGGAYVPPDPSWNGQFYEQWVRLSPRLSEVSLKPFLYLSRDRALALASYDELTPPARALLDLLLASSESLPSLTARLLQLGEGEAERILARLVRRASADQWSMDSIGRIFNISDAFPSLGPKVAAALAQIPAPMRAAPIGPLIRDKTWAAELVANWVADTATPGPLKTALRPRRNA